VCLREFSLLFPKELRSKTATGNATAEDSAIFLPARQRRSRRQGQSMRPTESLRRQDDEGPNFQTALLTVTTNPGRNSRE